MWSAKKIGLAVVCVVLLLLFGGCAPGTDAVCLSYQSSAARAEVRGRYNGAEFGATLELAAQNGTAARDVTVSYTSPRGLEGIVIKRREGVITLTFGDLTLPGDVFSEMAAPADAFMLTAAVSSANVVTDADGTQRTVVTLTDGSEVTLDPQSGFPLAIRTGGTELEILVYEPERN